MRPFSGSSTIRRFSMTVPTVAFDVAMSVVAADTSVSSVSVPSSSVKSTRSVSSTCSSTAFCTVLNPCQLGLDLVVPGGIAGNV